MTDASPKKDVKVNRERFLSVLNDITFAALETQQFDELLQLLADRLSEIIEADACFLTLWDHETGLAIPAAASGALREVYQTLKPKPDEPTITAHVLEAGKPIIIDDAWNSPLSSPRITHLFPTKTMLAIPIFSGNQKLGAALIGFEQHHQFTPQEIKDCEQAVRQIGLAIANSKNTDALKKSEEKNRLAAAALKESETHLAEAQENAKIGSWELEINSRRLHWSSGLYRLFDIEPRDPPPVRENLLALVDPRDRAEFGRTLDLAAENREPAALNVRTAAGRHLVGEMFYDPERDLLTGTMRDVTEERRLEAELLQARKMETIGTLAGGIAHNFNNILTVIMGNYEILAASIDEQGSERAVLNQCLDATERAAALTRQLLVVSKKHDLNPTELDLNSLITGIVELLAPVIGDHIETTTSLEPDLLPVYADQGHLEQVMINLMLNARDALQAGGHLKVTTENFDPTAGEPTARAKRVVAITVSDDGPGIDADVMPHIFDPFFTTKDEGKGTGLGLATVASIIEQSNGRVEVKSDAESGTQFRIILPTIRETPSRSIMGLDKIDHTRVEISQKANVLVVEDNESLRSLAEFVLSEAGHKVVTAADGPAALLVYQEHPVDLLVTDVQLPEGISGPQLAATFREGCPELPVVFMSGLRDTLPKQDKAVFLPKPFRPQQLVAVVSYLLEPQNPRVSE